VTSAGHGKYSYCQPVKGVIVPLATMICEKIKLGMSGLRFRGVVSFGIETEFVGVEKRMAAKTVLRAFVAVIAAPLFFAALSAVFHDQLLLRFFMRVRRVNVIVRRASFSNPCTRRMDRRNARGFATFIRRLRTSLPLPSFDQ
jgi:hypothetical protein